MFFFFFNDTATTEIYTLSLHDALPISSNTTEMFASPASSCARWRSETSACCDTCLRVRPRRFLDSRTRRPRERSEEHTSELQSRLHLVCRLLLAKKKKNMMILNHVTCI